jgi:hypothetical protein
MLGTILCLVGLHKWEWDYEWVETVNSYECHSLVRCRRGCKHYNMWRRIRQDVRTIW